jgi:REP element-mobilizing transposase RayT
MPRHRRLNIPGAIHHVITRGLNRQDIFFDDCDRNDFLGRLEKNLSLTGCRCCLSAQVIDPLGDLIAGVAYPHK